jgi:hypothetical protein
VSEDSAAKEEFSRWNGIKDSANPSDYESYLNDYPKGKFASLARSRLPALKKSAEESAEKMKNQAQSARQDTYHPPKKLENVVQVPPKVFVVVMPLIATGGLERDTVMSFENALTEALSTTYQVYYGKKVQDTVDTFYKARTSEAKAGQDCDDTKCLQDIAIAFQSELIAVCNVKKMADGFFISLKIQNVTEDTVVLSKNVTCENCNDFAAMKALQRIIVAPVISKAGN